MFFAEKNVLTKKEQVIFILAFQFYLKEHVKADIFNKTLEKAETPEEKEKIRNGKIFVVSACKNSTDRGATSTSIDEFMYHVYLNEENDKERIKELRVNQAAAALLVKRNNVLPERQIYLEMFIDHFNKLPEETKNAIRNYSPSNWKIKSHNCKQK